MGAPPVGGFGGHQNSLLGTGDSGSDQRLAGFGGITAGAKLILQATKNLEFDVSYDYMMQSDKLSPTAGNDNTKDFGAHYFELGLMRKF